MYKKELNVKPLTEKKEINFYESVWLSFFENCSYRERRLLALFFDFINTPKSTYKETLAFRDAFAKKAKCSCKTVDRFFKKLKELGLEIEQRRTKKGAFTSNLFIFDKSFKTNIKHLERLKLFEKVQNKEKYKKYIKKRLREIKQILQRGDL